MTTLTRNTTYAASAEEVALAAAAAALAARGYNVRRVSDGTAAKDAALDVLPEGAVVFTASSITADAIGLTKAIDESGRYTATRPQLIAMDPATQMSEMRRLGAAAEWWSAACTRSPTTATS